ncbi:tetratricopeptide repeat protein [Flavobacterium psychraquaticum]|uniref:tetratricopeptide repeat protein n=1 Tax=Flavobacterium psychraquaticum TaxID=3103958 RepID=UPI002ACD8459|nr:tetratricopeptide repeat protein [Flavobacterium sp. LB-N7T]
MKRIIYTFVILFITQLNFANDSGNLLDKARAYQKAKNYTEAIKSYETYIKISGSEDLKEVYVELANACFLQGNKAEAVNHIKTAITKYGFNEDEFIYSSTLNEGLSKYALSVVYDEYFTLRKQYLATLN